jgi:MFS family permease
VAHFAHHLLTALPGPLLPFIRNDFKLDYTQSALVSSSFTLSNGIGQLPAGWLADRIGRRILITIGICGVAVVGFLVGLSHTYIMMIILLVLMGVVAGGYHPAAAPLISASVEPDKQGRALGLHGIGGSASFFLAPLVAAAIAATWGWRSVFIVLAIPAVALGIIFFLLLGRRASTSEVQEVVPDNRGEASRGRSRRRNLVVFMILTVFAGGAANSISPFIPLYMVDHFGVSPPTAASLMAISSSAGLWASPLGGYLSDRIGRIPIILVTALMGGIFVYVWNVVPFGLGVYALLLLVGVSVYLRMPVAEAYIIRQTTARNRSTIYGIYYFVQMETGAVFAPLMGRLIDSLGFQSSFTIASIVAVATTLICSVFLWGSKEELY